MGKKLKVTVVMPAFNAEKTLEKTLNDIPEGVVDDIILVDDVSKDNTVKLAKKLNLFVFEHQINLGYGGNQKTCYKLALERGADIVVMIHPDYQYDSTLLPYLVEQIENERFDIMLGSRIRTRKEALAGGMPLYKYLANRILTLFENIVTGLDLSEFHTGFRAYSKKSLSIIPYELNSNNYVFDSQFLIQAIALNLRIGEYPVPVRYFDEASSPNCFKSIQYGIGTLICVFKFVLFRLRIVNFKCYQRRS
ncbi:MAG: glycosyltransferase family 2 protein [Candidatus Brocadiaceae bacterium]|nr:glycosyltransferase family 2 protein [Candidatus Brocadiaceae bacterium]